jgi:hypothetical protein
MPEKLPEDDLNLALAAVEHAQSVRKLHRRRTDKGNKQRNQDIGIALERLQSSMRPLRREIGRFPYGPQTDTAERNRDAIRAASKAVQSERRKLWKMRKTNKEVT